MIADEYNFKKILGPKSPCMNFDNIKTTVKKSFETIGVEISRKKNYCESYLSTNSENTLETFAGLRKIGYEDIVYYDNRGRILLAIKLTDIYMLSTINRYVTDRISSFPYSDIAIFHTSNKYFAETIIFDERTR